MLEHYEVELYDMFNEMLQGMTMQCYIRREVTRSI